MSTVSVHDPRTDDVPDGWADFVSRQQLHPVWDYQLMRLESWMARNPPVLAIVRDGGRVVAAVSAMVCRPWPEPKFAPLPTVYLRRMRPCWAEVCLPWLSGQPAFTFDPGLEPAERRAALREVERELARYLGFGLLGVLYRPIATTHVPIIDGRGRLTQEIDTTAVLENRWSTVDEWLGTLGHERRRSLRRYGKRIEADSTLVVHAGFGRDDLDPHELARLLHGHRERLGIATFDRRTPVAGAYLDSFVRRPDVHTLTYHDDNGTLLAFNTLIDHPVSPILHHWATLPVSSGGRYNLYFDCYLRGVRYMIDKGRPELSAGRGLQDIKTSLGFTRRALMSVAVPRPLVGR